MRLLLRMGPTLLSGAVLVGCGSSTASSPTATPIVVTNTPTVTPVVLTVVVTATPNAARRGGTPKPIVVTATPRPTATPLPTTFGLRLGTISRPLNVVRQYQAGVDRHDPRYAFWTHPDQVIRNTLPAYGFSKPVDLVSPARPFPRYAGRPVRKGVVKFRGTVFDVFVAQPARSGPTGVWVVVTILRQKLVTGGIPHAQATLQRIQAKADKRQPAFTLFLDPNKVVRKELPQYGFVPPFTVLSKATPVASASGRPVDLSTVSYGGVTYDVYLSQPVRQGPTGIWTVVSIQPHV